MIVCSNNGPGFTLTYFMARLNLVVCVFEWGNPVKWSFNGKNLQQMIKFTEDLY